MYAYTVNAHSLKERGERAHACESVYRRMSECVLNRVSECALYIQFIGDTCVLIHEHVES